MELQEKTAYNCCDYLHDLVNCKKEDENKTVDEKCRHKMVDWCYEVVACCNFSTETAIMAISYLDKFLSTKQGNSSLYDKRDFQLVSMCSLELAVKLNETTELDMHSLSKLSGGFYSEGDISDKEIEVLFALDWKMSSPTATVFAEHFLELLPHTVDHSVKQTLLIHSREQTECATRKYIFSLYKPSIVGLASVLNAIGMVDFGQMPENTRQDFHYNLIFIAGVDLRSPEIREVQNRLQEFTGKVHVTTKNPIAHSSYWNTIKCFVLLHLHV